MSSFRNELLLHARESRVPRDSVAARRAAIGLSAGRRPFCGTLGGNTSGMRLAALTSVVLLAIVGSAAARDVGRKPALRLVDRVPLTLVGLQFLPHERVTMRVEISGTESTEMSRRRATVGRNATFRVVIQSATLSRCDMLRVFAVGSGGSRAVLKLLPSP